MLRLSFALATTALALLAAVLEAPRAPGAAEADELRRAVAQPAHADAVEPSGEDPVVDTPPAGTCPRCEDTPDLTQTAAELALPDGGTSHCGPVATANALAWLSGRGFPALVDRGDLLATPRQLASPRYLATHPRHGTLPFDLVEGIERWVHDAGYELETLVYAGVRDHPARRSARLVRPDLAFLAAGLEQEGVVLLHLGWYEEARPGRLTRVGGHWVTLVHVDVDTNSLALNDPAPYAQDARSEHAQVEPLSRGRLLRPAGLGDLPARGFLELDAGFPRRSPKERAIVDGAVVLRVR